ncbi:Uncharacterised protein [uncultured Bacteroides sp.]|nr:Uncharacterised protein [uncultured Bacteroides sp.]
MNAVKALSPSSCSILYKSHHKSGQSENPVGMLNLSC